MGVVDIIMLILFVLFMIFVFGGYHKNKSEQREKEFKKLDDNSAQTKKHKTS